MGYGGFCRRHSPLYDVAADPILIYIDTHGGHSWQTPLLGTLGGHGLAGKARRLSLGIRGWRLSRRAVAKHVMSTIFTY